MVSGRVTFVTDHGETFNGHVNFLIRITRDHKCDGKILRILQDPCKTASAMNCEFEPGISFRSGSSF